ncbi:hypothetical protein C8J56DRAFT_803502, partial [Mycena floridula]
QSPMLFNLGSIIIKGGKIVSSGYNHQRPHYDEVSVANVATGRPVSMHVEMHAIFNITGGRAPPMKQQVQAGSQLQSLLRQKPPRKRPSSRAYTARSSSCEHRRQKHSKLNGADLYVVRVTKSGIRCSKPCWRCVDWCGWAGIKRIFYWNEQSDGFTCMKIRDAKQSLHETQADTRLFNR